MEPRKFSSYDEDVAGDYAYRRRTLQDQMMERWLEHYGCKRGSTCRGLSIVGYGVLRGDISTDALAQAIQAEAKNYAMQQGVNYACKYGPVACAAAVGVKGLMTGEVSRHELGEATGSAIGTAAGCTLGPLGCIAGGIAGSALGGMIADSAIGDAAEGIYNAGKSVINKVADILGL